MKENVPVHILLLPTAVWAIAAPRKKTVSPILPAKRPSNVINALRCARRKISSGLVFLIAGLNYVAAGTKPQKTDKTAVEGFVGMQNSFTYHLRIDKTDSMFFADVE